MGNTNSISDANEEIDFDKEAIKNCITTVTAKLAEKEEDAVFEIQSTKHDGMGKS